MCLTYRRKRPSVYVVYMWYVLDLQEEEAQLLAEQQRSAYQHLASGFHQHHHHHHHAAVGPAPLPTPSIILQDPLIHAAPPDIYVRVCPSVSLSLGPCSVSPSDCLVSVVVCVPLVCFACLSFSYVHGACGVLCLSPMYVVPVVFCVCLVCMWCLWCSVSVSCVCGACGVLCLSCMYVVPMVFCVSHLCTWCLWCSVSVLYVCGACGVLCLSPMYMVPVVFCVCLIWMWFLWCSVSVHMYVVPMVFCLSHMYVVPMVFRLSVVCLSCFACVSVWWWCASCLHVV